MIRALTLAAATAMLLSSCGGSDADLTVLAASSLVDVLGPASVGFEPTTATSFSGSSTIATQVIQGREVDVVITANAATMQRMISAGLIDSDPVVLATNQLVIAVPEGNPANVAELGDLANATLTIAACAPDVPCGAATAQLATNAGITLAIDTFDPNVRSVLTRVTTGAVDAGLVYTTDARTVADRVDTISVANEVNVTNVYLAAALVGADPAAQAFIEHLTTAGRPTFTAAGFGTP